MSQNNNSTNTSMVGTLGITAITIGITALGWTMAKRINFVRNYWKTCRSETINTAHGVRCSSWLPSNAVPVTSCDGSSDGDEASTATCTTNHAPTNATWFRVNDVIMGGKSTSELSTDAAGKLVFSGILSTDGGGFVSMRTTENCPVTVPDTATAVRVTLAGDGQLWKVNLGISHSLMSRDPTWSHDVKTTEGEITTHVLSLKDFSATRRGQRVEGAEAALIEDPSKICYVGLILSLYTQRGEPNPHFGDGPFKVVLHELEFV